MRADLAASEIVKGHSFNLEWLPCCWQLWQVSEMRSRHDPSDRYPFTLDNRLPNIEADIRECVSRVGDPLPECLVVYGLAIPRVAWVAQDFVWISDQGFQVAEITLVPYFSHEFCEHGLSILIDHLKFLDGVVLFRQ
jgi:hypothetical protein